MRIYCIIGETGTGKDTVFQKLLMQRKDLDINIVNKEVKNLISEKILNNPAPKNSNIILMAEQEKLKIE